jgi:hypothetical protein
LRLKAARDNQTFQNNEGLQEEAEEVAPTPQP